MRRESGTCNVCSAPCSSCMHPKRTLMGSKADEFSDENCRLGEADHSPMDEDGVTSLRSRACESLQHAVSETSNMLSVNSSHDSLSENADSRRTLSNKFQDSKSLDGLDDNTSSISRASDANLANGIHLRDSDGNNMSCSTASVNHPVAEGSGTAPSFETSNLSETPAFKDVNAGHNSPKVQSPSAQSWSSKSLSSSPGLMDMERDSCSHIPVKLSECTMGNIDSLLTKEAVPIIGPGKKCLADKDSLIVGTANVALKSYPRSEANTDNDVGTARDEAEKSSVQDGQDEKSEDLVEGRDMLEPKSEDESDESDVVEHDVKVCDICGDAGREDLLAICSRCSDGAEHTYCMREMLQKVPEGDWLCEECKCAEEADNQKLDVEERNTRKVSSTSQISGKRNSENIEAAPAAKRQALESNIGSPIASSPKRIIALSQESSFKSLDKGKVKPGQQMPIRNHSGSDNMECSHSAATGPRVPVSKGLLSKSNSFNAFNSKPRVKIVDEVVPQKQKGAGEHASKNIETPARMIGKSMSFKAVNLGRPNATESKVKMLSSKSIPALESKGSRHAKEWGALDRKTLYKGDRPGVSSTMSSSVISATKSDQKLTPRTEISKPSSVNNYRELKVNQDGKSSILSKSSSSLCHKGVEPPVSSEKPSSSADETLQDTVPASQETTNQIEKTRDSSNDRSLSGINTASKNAVQKCKEIGHPTESCTLGSTQEPGSEVSSTKSTKEEMHKGNRLRAALRAAMLRRPEIYKKKEIPNQTDDLSTSGADLNCEVTSQDQVLVSNLPNNSISTEVTQVGQKVIKNFSSETAKCSSVNDVKQLNACPTDSCSQPVDSDSPDPSGKSTASELPKQALPVSLVLPKMPIIPEYEYIWQGVFEVHRGGKPSDLCAGIQAHLSTCASPKVLQIANKFPTEVSLNEVPRLSSWPSQFHQDGAKEDHIALYFFAKDIESYERYYKGLLDHMTRNDLALKGIVDGVELLIFPSNQLPEKSQRWNMLFFLWGVFRGRRMKNSDSAKKICIPSLNVMPDEKDFHASGLPKHVDEESIAYDRNPSMVLASTCPEQGHVTLSRNSDIKESLFNQKDTGSQVYSEKKDSKVGPQEKLEKQDSKFDAKSSSRVPTGGAQLCQEMKSTVPSMKDCQTPQGSDRESKPFPEQVGTSVSCKIVEAKDVSDSPIKPESRIFSPGNQVISAASMTSENKSSETMNSVGNQPRPKRKPKDDHFIDIEAGFHGDTTFKGANYQESNAKTFQHIDLSDIVMQASTVVPQRMSWNAVNCKLEDGESASKKLRTDLSGIYGCGSSGVRDSFDKCFPSHANDFGSCSSVEDIVCEEACDEKIIREDLGNMERTFFPVDISDKNDALLGQNSMSQSHDYENHLCDGIPNLELALGGETKPPQKGMLPFFLGAVDEKNSHEKSPDCLAEEPEDDSVSASLSLSLAIPSLNKEPVKPVSKAQQHLPDGNHVNTSLLLFGRFTDK